MSEQDVDIPTHKGFLYLQGYMERVLLVPQPVTSAMWMSLYIIAFGANRICRKRDGKVSLLFLQTDDDLFAVEVQGDRQDLVDEVHDMVDAFGNDPHNVGRIILDGDYYSMERSQLPDHDDILEGLYEVSGTKFGPKVVAVFEHAAPGTHDEEEGAGREPVPFSPQMEYWASYWGMHTPRDRLN